MKNILKGKVKQSLFDALIEANDFEVPSAMIDSEISNMKQDTARRMGMDPKEMKEDLFPNETFSEEATKRVKVGILLNKIIEDKEIKPDADKVKEIIDERAKNYKDPEELLIKEGLEVLSTLVNSLEEGIEMLYSFHEYKDMIPLHGIFAIEIKTI